jgi:toxin ParE1/3/4
LQELEATLGQLEAMPGLGGPYPLSHPGLAGPREFPVRQFPSHIVFYLPVTDGIEVVRVLHAARDVVTTLEGEP